MIKKSFDKYFLMSKSERNGLNLLLVILVLVLVFRFLIPVIFPERSADRSQFLKNRSLAIDESAKRMDHQKKNPMKKTGRKEKIPDKRERMVSEKRDGTAAPVAVERFVFDPNTASEADLLKLGFSRKITFTLLKYREKGGRFYSSSDLLKIYGIDSVLFNEIEPYVRIDVPNDLPDQVKIELNTADTTALIALRGIGSSYARRICKYRDLLGGFYSPEQLLEVYNFPAEAYAMIKGSVCTDRRHIKTIRINFASLDELKKHPYIRYEKARKIIDHRSESGPFTNLEQLIRDSLLSDEEYKKLSNYLLVE